MNILILLGFVCAAFAAGPACSPACGSGLFCVMGTCISQTWPIHTATWEMKLQVMNYLEPDPINDPPDDADIARGGPDRRWAHLHRNSTSEVLPLWIEIWNAAEPFDFTASSCPLDVQYRIQDKFLTGWVSGPYYNATLNVNDAWWDTNMVNDGIFALTINVRYNPTAFAAAPACTSDTDCTSPAYCDTSVSKCFEYTMADFAPWPIYVHLRRASFPTTTLAAVGIDEEDYPDDGGDYRMQFSPNIMYVDSNSRRWRGYPARSDVTPFQGNPFYNDLYIEMMAPRTDLFLGQNMWWADPAHYNLPFIRTMPPKHDEDHRGLRTYARHERFPAKDGPRGVGWTSSYVTGQVDSQGRFAFAETSGRVGYIYPDGFVKTVAGWVTAPGKDPVWIKKPTATVRSNQVLKGTWLNGARAGESGGFYTALDVAIDPLNENIWYVPGYEDNCIWKVTIYDLVVHNVTVQVFAGDVNHTAGWTDGTGTAARFDGPTSAVFDHVNDVLYVADQNRGNPSYYSSRSCHNYVWR